jgi:hypothetical protein
VLEAPSSSSPRKRKAQGPQQAAPPPTSQPQYTSPPFSHGGSSVSGTPSTRPRGHSRQRSDLSYGRTSRRHRHSESGMSRGASPVHRGYEPLQAVESSRTGTYHDPIGDRSEHRSQHHERTYSAEREPRHGERHTPERESSSRYSTKREDRRD